MRAFRSGELYLVKGEGKNKRYIYPTIHAVSPDIDKVEYVFSIPLGLDPAKIEKSFIFEQEFGKNYSLERAQKRFNLKVYKSSLEKFKFKLEAIMGKSEGFRLPIVVGNSYKGFLVYDMVPYPHLLIAGETGSGKSTQIRSILTTLINCLSPEQLHLYLADLKRTELTLFRRVKHVQGDVAVEASSLIKMVTKLKKEMQDRGDLLDTWELAHIDDYNAVAKDKKPYIVLCIDEVAEIKNEKKIMDIIESIGSIGRALGVFLILSMQRPDKDVLDGKLKNNLTVRMAFRHSDDINSWITLGRPNSHAAEIGIEEKGRFWFKHESLELVQSPELTLSAAKKLLEPYKVPKEDIKDLGEVEEVKPQKQQILGVLDDA